MLVEEKGDFFFPIFIVFIKKNIFEKKMIVLIILDLIDFFFFKIYDNYEIPIQNYIFVKDNFKIIEVISFKKR